MRIGSGFSRSSLFHKGACCLHLLLLCVSISGLGSLFLPCAEASASLPEEGEWKRPLHPTSERENHSSSERSGEPSEDRPKKTATSSSFSSAAAATAVEVHLVSLGERVAKDDGFSAEAGSADRLEAAPEQLDQQQSTQIAEDEKVSSQQQQKQQQQADELQHQHAQATEGQRFAGASPSGARRQQGSRRLESVQRHDRLAVTGKSEGEEPSSPEKVDRLEEVGFASILQQQPHSTERRKKLALTHDQKMRSALKLRASGKRCPVHKKSGEEIGCAFCSCGMLEECYPHHMEGARLGNVVDGTVNVGVCKTAVWVMVVLSLLIFLSCLVALICIRRIFGVNPIHMQGGRSMASSRAPQRMVPGSPT